MMMLEDDMVELMEAEKERVENAQQAQLIAEKALQDCMSVNINLQKQVLSQTSGDISKTEGTLFVKMPRPILL